MGRFMQKNAIGTYPGGGWGVFLARMARLPTKTTVISGVAGGVVQGNKVLSVTIRTFLGKERSDFVI